MAAGMGTRKSWTELLETKMKDMGRPEWKDIEEAFAHIKKEEDRGQFGVTCYYAAYLCFTESRSEDAVDYLMEGIRCLAETREERYIARCYNILGIIAHGQNNLILAVEQYDTALEYVLKYEEKMMHSMILGNMADAFYRMGAYERAINCYVECIGEYQGCGQDSVNGEYNFQMILACCGYCLVMGEYLKEACEVADYLWGKIREEGQERFPRLPVYTFFALLCHEKGLREEADACMEAAICEVKKNISTTSDFDHLLDLLNYLIMVKKNDRLEEAEKLQEMLGILFVDIDYFKQLNDRYGHCKGDECIRAVGDALKKSVPDEFTARYGGDEFVVVMKKTSVEAVRAAACRIQQAVCHKQIPNEDSDTAEVVTVTIGGVCAVPKKMNRVWDFMKEADEALYEQKRAGRGLFCCREMLGEEI